MAGWLAGGDRELGCGFWFGGGLILGDDVWEAHFENLGLKGRGSANAGTGANNEEGSTRERGLCAWEASVGVVGYRVISIATGREHVYRARGILRKSTTDDS